MATFNETKLSKIKWGNNGIAHYYENVPIKDFQDFITKGGLDNGCDIELIYPFIKSRKTLLEVGAGYGRVIEHLIEKGDPFEIYGIERSKHFFEYTQNKFKDNTQVHLILKDIQQYEDDTKFDAILWMWAGISDFPKTEQLQVLEKLSTHMNDHGIFIIETIKHTLVPKNATASDAQSYMIETHYGNLYGYLPSPTEIKNYAQALGLTYAQELNYQTTTGRDRVIHILRKA